MHDRVNRLDTAFPIAASIALELIRRPEVSDRWARPSALPKMSVGALACHLGRQALRAAELLPMTTDAPPLDSVDEHFERSAWVTAGPPEDRSDDPGPDETEASLGPSALDARAAGALESVRSLLAGGAARDVVPIPWQDWSLRRDDFLLTRLLEIVVHADDLAVSVGVPSPEFPDGVFAPCVICWCGSPCAVTGSPR